MFIPPNTTATTEFQVQLGASAIALNSPVAVVIRDGVDTAVVATISTPATGRYVVSFTVPANWEFPQRASVRLSGLVNGVEVEFTKASGQVGSLSGAGGGGDDAATIYSYFTASTRPDPFKADISTLLTSTTFTTTINDLETHGDSNWATATGFLTSLGTNAPTNWFNANSVATDAVTKIQTGLSTYDGSDTSGTSTLLLRLSSARAGYLDKLNVTGVLAHTDNASAFQANVAGLTAISTAVDLIKAKTDLLVFTGNDVRATLDGETVAVGDKTGFSLTSGERTAIATAVEAALLNEGDGQQLIDAILQVINSNLDLPALELTAIAQAVRSELSTELARLDTAITSRLADSSYVAPNNSGITDLLGRLTSLRASYLDKLNVSGTLANTDNAATFRADLTSLSSAIALIPGYFTELQDHGDDNWSTAVIDLSGIQSNIGLLLSKNMLTLNKPVSHSPNQIVIGNDEVVIDLVVDSNTDTVTGTRTT